MIVKVKT